MLSSVPFSFADSELLADSFSGSLVMFLLAKIDCSYLSERATIILHMFQYSFSKLWILVIHTYLNKCIVIRSFASSLSTCANAMLAHLVFVFNKSDTVVLLFLLCQEISTLRLVLSRFKFLVTSIKLNLSHLFHEKQQLPLQRK